MPAQPGQAGPQAKKTSAPGAHPWSSAPPSRSRACWANRFRWISTPRPAPRARATPRPGCRAGGRPARALTAIEGYTTQSERTPVRQIIFVDPSIDNAEQMVQGLPAWSAARPKDWADWPGRRARARSCRCCAAMTPRSSCWTAAMTASTRSPESWGSTDLAAVQIATTAAPARSRSVRRRWARASSIPTRTSCALGATRWPNRATSCSTAATWPPARRRGLRGQPVRHHARRRGRGRIPSAAPRWAATGCWTTVTAPSRPPR